MTEKLRSSKITIEIPKVDSEPWVHVTVNKMFLDDDGEMTNNQPRFDYISKPLSSVGTEIYTFMDPVTQQEVTISGYGLASAITSYVKNTIEEKHGEGSMA